MKNFCTFIVISMILFALPLSIGLIFKITLPESGSNFEPVKIKYHNAETKKTEEMDLEEYLVGVLAAEMPASYPKEALKAQAVAARSYILSKKDMSNPDHPEAIVCTDPNHCKGYLTKTEAMKKWDKKHRETCWNTLKNAVNETHGQYLKYEGKAAAAFFFARSGGRTENSEDVWQSSLPYLRSVDSHWDICDNEHLSCAEFSHGEIRRLLNIPHNGSAFTASIVSRTQGGSCNIVNICGINFKGQQIRRVFNLKSANFDLNVTKTSLIFTVQGYGHGVGMSQFGAKCMAQEGNTYTEILDHYYKNTQLVIP